LTLIELIVVIMVLLLATGVIVPSFTRFQAAAQFDWTVRRTLLFAGEARGLAIASEHPVTITLDPASHALRLAAEPSEADADREPSGTEPPLQERMPPELRLVPLPPDVRVTLETDGPAREAVLRFYPDGRADEGVIRLQQEGRAPIVLAVNPRTGRLTVQEDQP
jgi:type II secretory pathway pseudopilin PulG